MFPNRVPVDTFLAYRANGLVVHSYPSDSPVKEFTHENGQNICSPYSEPHMDIRPTYNGVQPGSPTGLFTTLQFLPQLHAALSMTPSTLTWVD